MASLFKKDDSPYWQLRYRDDDGRWRNRTTKFRVGFASETSSARRLCAEESAKERQSPRPGDSARWAQWVQGWIDSHFASAKSATRAGNAWAHLERFFEARGLKTPASVRYEHAQAYMRARKAEGAAHNTVVLELKIGGQLLQEAVRRGLVASNVWMRLGIKRERPAEKPEIDDDQFVAVEKALESAPQWMQDSWLVTNYQGWRISEVAVPLSDINEAEGVVFVRRTKGDRPFATALHPALLPLIARRRAEGASTLCDLPPNAAKRWWIFLRRKLGMPFSIHSTRVTVITRMARAKVHPTIARAFVNHSSELVHRIYQRMRPADLSEAVSAVSRIGAPPESPDSPPSTPEHA